MAPLLGALSVITFSSRSSPRPALVGAEEGWILTTQWKTLMGHVRSWGRTLLGQKTVSTGGSGMTPPSLESCLLSCFISRLSLTLAWAPKCLNCFSFSHPLTSLLLWTFGPIFFCQGNLLPAHIFYWQTFTLLSGHKWDMALPSRTPSPWDKAPFFPIPPLLTPLCWLLSPLFQAARAAAVSSPGTPALSLGTGGLSIWWLNLYYFSLLFQDNYISYIFLSRYCSVGNVFSWNRRWEWDEEKKKIELLVFTQWMQSWACWQGKRWGHGLEAP